MKTRIFLFLLFILGFTQEALALKTSPNALRIEDSKSGNIVLGAEQASLEAGEVYKTILVLWGNFQVYGQADEIILLSGNIKFHPGSKVTKSLVLIGGAFEALPGADVAGEKVVFQAAGPFWNLTRSAGNLWRNYYEGTARVIASLSFCLVIWLSGLLLFALFPKLQKVTEGELGIAWPKNLFAGILGSIFAPILFILLILSIIGIFVLPFYLMLLSISGYVSYMAAALWVGHRILPPKKGQRVNTVGFLLGIIFLQIFWYSGVWFAYLFVFLLWTIAWGTLVRALRTLWN